MDLSEFLLPLLVTDRICFGKDEEFDQICDEFKMILDFESSEVQPMMLASERRKAVTAVFRVMDTLIFWEERDTEDASRKVCAGRMGTQRKSRSIPTGEGWGMELTKSRIRRLRRNMPLIMLAKAASSAGMHAKALQFSELFARSAIVTEYFESTDGGKGREWQGSVLQRPLMDAIPTELTRKVLNDLNDCETVRSLGHDASLPAFALAASGISTYEAEGNYEQALKGYELALHCNGSQTSDNVFALEKGGLRCLLQLGKFESVLSRVESRHLKGDNRSRGFAVEAAWRLGNWDELSNLVPSSDLELGGGSDETFQVCLGKVMLSLQHRCFDQARDAVHSTRESAMGGLATVARESYSKSYQHLVQLHQVREIEDALVYLEQDDGESPRLRLRDFAGSVEPQGWSWDDRLSFPSPEAISTIMQTRLAIARAANDSFYESSLLLDVGRHARKYGLTYLAESSLCSAEDTLIRLSGKGGQDTHRLAGLVDEVRTEYAKLKKQCGENILALQILKQGST